MKKGLNYDELSKVFSFASTIQENIIDLSIKIEEENE